MGSLMYIVRFCDKEDVDLPELFPRSYEEKGVLISTDDVVELIKVGEVSASKISLFSMTYKRDKFPFTNDRSVV